MRIDAAAKFHRHIGDQAAEGAIVGLMQERQEQFAQPLKPASGRRKPLDASLQHRPVVMSERRVEEAGLVAEGVIDASAFEPRCLLEVPDRRTLIAVLAKICIAPSALPPRRIPAFGPSSLRFFIACSRMTDQEYKRNGLP